MAVSDSDGRSSSVSIDLQVDQHDIRPDWIDALYWMQKKSGQASSQVDATVAASGMGAASTAHHATNQHVQVEAPSFTDFTQAFRKIGHAADAVSAPVVAASMKQPHASQPHLTLHAGEAAATSDEFADYVPQHLVTKPAMSVHNQQRGQAAHASSATAVYRQQAPAPVLRDEDSPSSVIGAGALPLHLQALSKAPFDAPLPVVGSSSHSVVAPWASPVLPFAPAAGSLFGPPSAQSAEPTSISAPQQQQLSSAPSLRPPVPAAAVPMSTQPYTTVPQAAAPMQPVGDDDGANDSSGDPGPEAWSAEDLEELQRQLWELVRAIPPEQVLPCTCFPFQ